MCCLVIGSAQPSSIAAARKGALKHRTEFMRSSHAKAPCKQLRWIRYFTGRVLS